QAKFRTQNFQIPAHPHRARLTKKMQGSDGNGGNGGQKIFIFLKKISPFSPPLPPKAVLPWSAAGGLWASFWLSILTFPHDTPLRLTMSRILSALLLLLIAHACALAQAAGALQLKFADYNQSSGLFRLQVNGTNVYVRSVARPVRGTN